MSMISNDYKFILASASPRRKEILSKLGFPFEVKVSSCDENVDIKEPDELVEILSKLKATDVAGNNPGCVVIGADTVVAAGGCIMGKPATKAEAFDMIKRIAGNVHQVFTGVTVIIPGKETVSFVEKTDVHVTPMTDREIEEYVDSGEPMDKAGAYAIQGLFAPFISKIDGDYYNVVGLPISALYMVLRNLTDLTG